MRNTTLAVLVLTLSSIACGQQVVVTTPTIQADNTAQPITTPDNTPAAPSLLPTPTAEAETAEVRAATVNVRAEPGGEVVGQVYAGMDVKIVACADGWCEIRTSELSGWVFEGCLSVETEKGCEAK
jgi:hypothetical protein